MDEINRFIQKPPGEECPKWETRQYLHPQYGLIEISVNKCKTDNVEEAFGEKMVEVLENIEKEHDNIVIVNEDGEEIVL